MKKEQLAEMLNGIEYMGEGYNDKSRDEPSILTQACKLAKEHGLIIVHGASDDTLLLAGAAVAEAGANNGGSYLIDAKGLLSEWDDVCATGDKGIVSEHLEREGDAQPIEAVFGEDVMTWQYRTDVPHATFDILEDDEIFCRGLVIDVNDLPGTGNSVQKVLIVLEDKGDAGENGMDLGIGIEFEPSLPGESEWENKSERERALINIAGRVMEGAMEGINNG